MLELSMRSPPHSTGFTLIELMVTIAVLTVLMTLAVPSFMEFRRSSELAAATNALVATINTAKSEAMKRSVNAGIAPLTGTDWNSGIRIFVDNNLNGQFDTGDLLLSDTHPDGTPIQLPAQFKVTSSSGDGVAYVGFTASGYLQRRGASGNSGNTTFTIARTDPAASGLDVSRTTRRIVIALSGRVRSCKPASATDATCLEGAGS